MDELTVSTLAQGLAKLIRLWKDDWQIIMLFHGEDDMERFRREVPSACYFLPWLSPSDRHDEELEIKRDRRKSNVSTTIQNIKDIITERE